MREIKFRGKTKMSIEKLNELGLKHENGWIYGRLVMYGKTPYIVGDFIEVSAEYTVNEFWAEVIPDTVGQYTELKDEHDKEIYEGDIVKHAIWGDVYEVVFEDGGFYVISPHDFQTINKYPLEVIGSIFENPELLEDEGKMNNICRACNGSGGIDIFDDSIGEIVTITCPDCGGSGVNDD